jgi:hypothetical protein
MLVATRIKLPSGGLGTDLHLHSLVIHVLLYCFYFIFYSATDKKFRLFCFVRISFLFFFFLCLKYIGVYFSISPYLLINLALGYTYNTVQFWCCFISY